MDITCSTYRNIFFMLLEELQLYCESFPAVTTDIKWENNLCFSVGAKMFCMIALDESFRVSFKVSDDVFDELAAREGCMEAPYLSRARWISVVDPGKLRPKEWEHFLHQSYTLVKSRLTKKIRNELGLL
jgi:predicted DNA-binding protein (MmcQ/YjbR family)